jgi:hypothetical protein
MIEKRSQQKTQVLIPVMKYRFKKIKEVQVAEENKK